MSRPRRKPPGAPPRRASPRGCPRAPLASDVAEIVDGLGDAGREFLGRTVLLFGSCGFLGRYMVHTFAALNARHPERPCRVFAMDSLITGERPDDLPWGTHLRFKRHNIIEPIRVPEPPVFIIHMAGIASPFYYRAYPLETLDVAVLGTRRLLEIARHCGSRMVYFSSSEIYGDPDPRHVPTLESYRGNVNSLGPRACYDESKRLAETLCWIYHERYGTQATIVRPFNVYGPGMKEKDYRVLPNIAGRVQGGQPVHVYGTGRQTRTFCYATDAVVGFLLALLKGNPGEAYNIGNPVPEISMVDLVKTVSKVLGRRVPMQRIDYPDSYPADEPMRRCPDITKARLQLGYNPSVPLEEGLKRFFSWTSSAYRGTV